MYVGGVIQARRVAWQQKVVQNDGTVLERLVPFLRFTRSLGDFWSFDIISPVPSVSTFSINSLARYKILIIASNGLWNIISASSAVQFVRRKLSSDGYQQCTIARELTHEAIRRYQTLRMQADNISVIVTTLHSPNCPDQVVPVFNVQKDKRG